MNGAHVIKHGHIMCQPSLLLGKNVALHHDFDVLAAFQDLKTMIFFACRAAQVYFSHSVPRYQINITALLNYISVDQVWSNKFCQYNIWLS